MSGQVPNLGKVYQKFLASRKVAGDFAQTAITFVTDVQMLAGSYTVKSGELVRVGGDYAYIVPSTTTPTRIEGKVLIFVENATGSTKVKVAEWHTGQTTDEADKNKKIFIPLSKFQAKKDSKIKIEFIADTGAASVVAQNVYILPVQVTDVA